MRLFHCNHCGALVFFENFQCVNCGSTLAFVREHVDMLALEPLEDQPGLWICREPRAGCEGQIAESSCNAGMQTPRAPALRYRLCANRTRYEACNFALLADPHTPEDALCTACQHTRVLPDLNVAGNLRRWSAYEQAKRRLYYVDIRLGLDQLPGEAGPTFEFLADLPGHPPVLTGHASGLITLNIAEADDDERVRRRLAFHEPYRTLLGHLRHEIGHYYWDVLIARGGREEAFRAVFGDERQDYAQALQAYYDRTPYPDQSWQQDFVSAYATAHPWEDWAETWAHYMHLLDLLETAHSFDAQINMPTPQGVLHYATVDPFTLPPPDFDTMLAALVPTTLLLNSLTRSLGQSDAYPFALSAGARGKMRFVHETVSERRRAAAGLEACPKP